MSSSFLSRMYAAHLRQFDSDAAIRNHFKILGCAALLADANLSVKHSRATSGAARPALSSVRAMAGDRQVFQKLYCPPKFAPNGGVGLARKSALDLRRREAGDISALRRITSTVPRF